MSTFSIYREKNARKSLYREWMFTTSREDNMCKEDHVTMRKPITIGPAIIRRRQALGWTLQRVCDETGGALYTGYLSDIEKGKSVPSIDKAHALATVLGTTIDQLIDESVSGTTPLAPTEHATRSPVVPWDLAAQWAQSPDISRLPSGTPWEVPLDSKSPRGFFLRLSDESMHAPAGPAFPNGSLIYVDPDLEYQVNDFVVGYDSDPTAPTFKKYVRHGSQSYLQSLNPQFPALQIDGNFQVIGVVIGMTMRTSRGLIR
jgi:SOS-response transcriptional repressor LexA